MALYFVMPDTVIQRFTSIGDLGDSSTPYRVSIWMGSLAMLKDYWLCGIGPGTEAFNMVYPIYGYARPMPSTPHNNTRSSASSWCPTAGSGCWPSFC